MKAQTSLARFIDCIGSSGDLDGRDYHLSGSEEAELVSLLKTFKLAQLFVAAGAHVFLSPSLAKQLAERARMRRERSREVMSDFLQVQRSFAARSIPFVPLKGPIISQVLYGDPYARDSTDTDLLIESHHAPEADWILRSLGYYQNSKEFFSSDPLPRCPPFFLVTPRQRVLCEYERSHEIEDLAFELHLSIRHLSKNTHTDLFSSIITYSLDGSVVSGPDLPRACILFILDKYKDFEHGDFFSIRDVLDIYRLSYSLSPEAWKEVRSISERYGCVTEIAETMRSITSGRLGLKNSAACEAALGDYWSSAPKFTYFSWEMLTNPDRDARWGECQRHLSAYHLTNDKTLTVPATSRMLESSDADQVNCATTDMPNELASKIKFGFNITQDEGRIFFVYDEQHFDYIGDHSVQIRMSSAMETSKYPGAGYALYLWDHCVEVRFIGGRNRYEGEICTDGTTARLQSMEGRICLTISIPNHARHALKIEPLRSVLFNISIRRKYYAFHDRHTYGFYELGATGPFALCPED